MNMALPSCIASVPRRSRAVTQAVRTGGPCSLGPFGYDCAPGAYCQDFTCEVQKADGAPCESALACKSLWSPGHPGPHRCTASVGASYRETVDTITRAPAAPNRRDTY